MNRALILLLITFSSLKVFSQDLIVTAEGDSINCKISKVESEKIHFTYIHNLEIKNTFLLLSKIKTKQFNYYSRSAIPHDYNSGIGEFKPFQISIDGGFSLEIARLADGIPDNLKDYYENLKSGYNIGAGLTYYIDETIGFGLKYQCFLSTNNIDNVDYKDLHGQAQFGSLSDKLNISFIGPSLSLRYFDSNGKNSLYTNYYTGYVHYKDDAMMNDLYKVTGGTIGLGIEGGYDIELSPDIFLGFQASFLAGVLRKLKVDDGEKIETVNLKKGSYENISRIDVSIALSFK